MSLHPNWKALSTVDFNWKQFVREESSKDEVHARKIYRPATTNSLTGEEAKRIYEEIVESESSQLPEVKIPLATSSRSSNLSSVNKVYQREGGVKWLNALMTGAQENDVDCVSSLTRGKDVNVTDQYGWTPLMTAACAGSVDVVRFLIEHGANVQAKDKSGNTCLSLANKRRHNAVVEAILKPQLQQMKTSMETNKEAFYCEQCKQHFTDTTQTKHLSSTVHLFSSKPQLSIPTSYGIPTTNKGYQILLKGGWDSERGLGPEGSGTKFPLKTILKSDRKGLGNKQIGKPRVTHFPSNVKCRERTIRTTSSRHSRKAQLCKERLKERQLRQLGLLENPQKSLEYLEQLEKLGEEITRDKQEVVAIDRRRNQNREALRAMRLQQGKIWFTLGTLLVKVEVEKAKQLDLKIKVNKLRDMEFEPPVPGLMLNPMTRTEFSAVGQTLGRHA
ncbi:hypothetical protein C0J52_03811 [Blattella germanica]|nr:hypothetical protein C0J52_03811 [Blattella germanica]